MQSKYTLEQKKECLLNGYISKYNDFIKLANNSIQDRENDDGEMLEPDYETFDEIKSFIKNNEMLDCAERLQKSRKAKTIKVVKKITRLVKSGQAVFLTLTFTDNTLNNTTPETRRRYVARYLKSQCDFYVANIDFGEDNGREHYHALVNGRVNLKMWLYGAINSEKAHTSAKDKERIAKYITKLTYHAIKSSTCPLNQRLIYSRNV